MVQRIYGWFDWLSGLISRKWKRALLSPAGAFITGSGFDYISTTRYKDLGWCWIIACSVLFFAISWPRNYDKDILEAAATSFFRSLKLGTDPNAVVRVAIWVPKNDCLIPVTRYVPSNSPVKLSKLQEGKGIVGQVYRMGEADFSIPDPEVHSSPEAFVKWAMEKWNFTKDEAKALSYEPRFYLAMPIFDQDAPKTVVAVLYCDSTEPLEFEKAEEVAEFANRTGPFLSNLIKVAREG